MKSELWRIAKLGEKPQRTWNEAVVRWLKEKSHKATAKARMSPSYAGSIPSLAAKTLTTITRATLDKITDEKLAQGLQQCNGESDAGAGARDSAQVRQRVGVVGSGARKFACCGNRPGAFAF